MRISFHLSGTRAQNVRDRFPAFRLVQFLHGTFVEQENRDLLQTSNFVIISHALFSIIARIYLRNEAREWFRFSSEYEIARTYLVLMLKSFDHFQNRFLIKYIVLDYF